MPSAVCYLQALTMEPIKGLKDKLSFVATSGLVRNAGYSTDLPATTPGETSHG